VVTLRKRAFNNIVGFLAKNELSGVHWKLQGAFHLCFLGIRDRLPVDRLFLGLHRDSIGINGTDDVSRGDLATISHDRRRLHEPIVTVLSPRAFTVSAIGLEVPRTDLLVNRIPADPLRPAIKGAVFRLDCAGRDDEVLIW